MEAVLFLPATGAGKFFSLPKGYRIKSALTGQTEAVATLIRLCHTFVSNEMRMLSQLIEITALRSLMASTS